MTISSTGRKAGPYEGNGITTAFPFDFKVFSGFDLRVVHADSAGAETDLVFGTDFTAALNADQDATPGGTVTLATALATGAKLTITSSLELLQLTDLTNNGGFYPRVLNDLHDRLVIYIQQLSEQISRTLKSSISSPISSSLPAPAPLYLIGWNGDGSGFANYPQGGGGGGGGGSGTVTAVSVASANGLSGTVANASTAPSITLGTTITGIAKAVAGAFVSATAGTDYVAPGPYASANGLTMAAGRLLGRSTAGSGAAEEIAIGTGLTLSGGTLSATGGGGSPDASAVSFTPAGTGAVATTVQSKLREVISVFDFLTPAQIADVQTRAMTYDLTTPIQNALNAAMNASNPMAVHFPAGTYKCGGLTYASSVYHLELYGDGSGHTILINTLNTSPVLTFSSNPNQVTIRGITFRGNGSVRSWGSGNGAAGNSLTGTLPTSEAAVRLIDMVHADFHDCYFQDAKWGVDIQGGILVTFRSCYAYYNGEVGYRIWKSGSSGWPNIIAFRDGGAKENGQVGIYFDQGRQLILDGVDVEGNGNNTVQASGLACGLYIGTQTGIENGATNGPNSTAFHTLAAAVRNCWFEKNGNNTGGGTPSSTQTAHVISNHGFLHVEDCISTNCTAGRHFRINGGQYSIERVSFESALTVSTNYIDEGVTTGNASLVGSNYINNNFFNTPGTAADLTGAYCTVDTSKTFFNYGGGGGGGTPTLAAVTTAGNTTTNNATFGTTPITIGTVGGVTGVGSASGSMIAFSVGSSAMLLTAGSYYPNANNTIALGSNSARFSAAYVQGTFQWGGYNISAPPGSTSSFLRADGSWATPTMTESDTLATVVSRGSSTSNNITVGAGSQATLGTLAGVAAVGSTSAEAFAITTASYALIWGSNRFYPTTDNTAYLGDPAKRWGVVYAGTGTINTSDRRMKQQIRPLSEAERAVAGRLKGLIRAFKFNDAVAAKGDSARIHVGVIAQDVEAAFAAEGLVADQYGVFCRDTFECDGAQVTQLGVRYEELLAFIIGAIA